MRDARGREYAYEVGGYFEDSRGAIDEWIFSAAPAEVKAGLRKFRVPRFRHTLAAWVNMIVDAGLRIERMAEPCASQELAERYPAFAHTRIVPYFLHVRCRKGW